MIRLTTAIGAALALLLAACPDLGAPPAEYADPTDGYDETDKLKVTLVDPAPGATVTTAAPTLTMDVLWTGSQAIEAVEVSMSGGSWQAATSDDGARWTLQVGLLPGDNDVRMRVRLPDGRRSETSTVLTYTGEAPALRLTAPVSGGWAGQMVTVAGEVHAMGGATVAEVAIGVDGGASQTAAVTADGTFEGQLDSGATAPVVVFARATDSEGRTTEVRKTLALDEVAPTLAVAAPVDGTITADAVLAVSGTAGDDVGLASVEVRVNSAGWIVARGDEAWETEVGLTPGENVLTVRATDVGGNTTVEQVRVWRSRIVTLRAPEDGSELLTLTLDRAGMEALIPPEDAAEIDMLYLDLEGVLVEALKAMRDYEIYGVDTSTWGAAEWNMHKILTMSPDTADVSGTSLEPILELSQGLGIPVPVVLGDLADIAPTDPFLTIDQLAKGLFAYLIAPHPSLVVDPEDGRLKVPVTLADALGDMVGLGDKLGPAGDHPGILFDANPAPVLLPNFAMTVSAKSNLTEHDGIDLAEGKSYLFVRPADGELLEFDFLNPDWFSVVGLADEPEVDLAFQIDESPGFVPAGTSKTGHELDGFERGDSPVWDLPTWLFERAVAQMMFDEYHGKFAGSGYQDQFSYDVGALTDAATVTWDHGWLTIETVGGVGDPPPPQYFWDAVLELAQVRLHDGGLAEGEADLHMLLEGVRVPLTAEQLVDATRPVLEAQKATMAEIMVGDLSSYDSDVDVFLATGVDGKTYLYFTDADDIPGAAQTHAKPGFFSDPGLSTKVSTAADGGSGDARHEKVPVSTAGGEIYFVGDVDGRVWKLTMLPMEAGEVKVRVEPGGSWP